MMAVGTIVLTRKVEGVRPDALPPALFGYESGPKQPYTKEPIFPEIVPGGVRFKVPVTAWNLRRAVEQSKDSQWSYVVELTPDFVELLPLLKPASAPQPEATQPPNIRRRG